MQKVFIGPWDVGEQKNLTPFMLPEKAFEVMTNAFTFRGRVRKKPGYELNGRLTRVFTEEAAGNSGASPWSSDVYTLLGITPEANAELDPGTVVFDFNAGAEIVTDNGDGTLTGSLAATGTINYLTGAFTITGAAAGVPVLLSFSYFPNLPVMGLLKRELSPAANINFEQSIAFDTVYAYDYVLPNGWRELPSTLTTIWSGDNTDFFWECNYFRDAANNDLFWTSNSKTGNHAYIASTVANYVAGPPTTADITTTTANNFQVGDTVILVNSTPGTGSLASGELATVTVAGNPFSVSFNSAQTVAGANGTITAYVVANRGINQNLAGQDGIRFYNGVTWQNANPVVNSISLVTGTLIMLPFKDRLLLLNTWETDITNTSVNFPQRCRWSWNGTPLDFSQGWLDDRVGFGGYVDAPTNERIITAEALKDEIIVYFERSTWKIVYTGNDVLPFIFQRINAELGAESTYSAVRFDNGIVAVGSNGLHTTNGQSVARIDEVIPDTVFDFNNNNSGVERVYAIRDFFLELAYFSYPRFNPSNVSNTFPNRVLCYNYRDNCYSFFTESFTCYGNFQRASDYIWATLPYNTWTEWTNSWNSGQVQARYNSIIAGNQQGFVVQLNPANSGVCETRYIQAIASAGAGPYTITVTSPEHNLVNNDYIYITGCIGATTFNGQVVQVRTTPTSDTFTFQAQVPLTGTYIGGGVIEVLQNIDIKTKQFNPYWQNGKQVTLVQGEFLLDRTAAGAVATNVFVSMQSTFSMNNADENIAISPDVLLGNNIVSTAPEPGIPVQLSQPQIWHHQYYQAIGDTFQLEIKLSDDQMADQDRTFVNSNIVIHGMLFTFEEGGEFL